MKLTVFLKAVLFVVLVNYTAVAQEVLKVEADSIPVLEEWWRAPDLLNEQYYGGMTYLPNFKDGQGALVVATPTGTHTWMLRYPGDTANVFTWKFLPILYADFNGDDITDYMDYRGNIYPGIQNGQPPMKEPIEGNSSTNLGMNSIGDFNGDGFDDMVIARDPQGTIVATLVMGGSDLKKLRVIDIPKTGTDKNWVVGAQQNEQGEWRLTSRWYGNIMGSSYDEGFVLWKLNFTGEGDSLKATVSEVQRYKEKGTKLGTYNYYAPGIQIYKSKYSTNVSLLAPEGALVSGIEGEYNMTIFNIANDSIVRVGNIKTNGVATLLHTSIDNDKYEDFSVYSNKSQLIYPGSNIFSLQNLQPIAKVSACGLSGVNLTGIGDVNNDGISDMAALGNAASEGPYMGYDCFTIVLGQDLTAEVEQEVLANSFSLKTFKTAPSHFTISFTLLKESHATFSLFDMEGKLVKVVKEGMFESGEQSFVWDAGDMPQGAYLLQLSAGGHIATEKIIITR
jgi:hypothetical protein